MKRKITVLAAVITICFLVTGTSYSQCAKPGKIFGYCYVEDTGKPLFGVLVLATHQETGRQYLAITIDHTFDIFDGIYRIPFSCPNILLEGKYTVVSQAIFSDGNTTYIRVTDQYTDVDVRCGESAWTINFAYEIKTAVLLYSFDAAAYNSSVVLTWETGDETDNFGFNIYRFEEDSELIRVNDSIIHAKGAEGLGADYEFVDNDVQNRKEYTYILEDVDIFGNKTLHDAINIAPRLIYGKAR